MKFSVCIGAVFNGRDVFESLKAVKSLGINTFEFWVWWDTDLTPYRRAKDELGMEISCFCTKFITLTDPAQRSAYMDGLKASVDTAGKLGVRQLISQVGNAIPGVSRKEQHQSIVDGLKACAPILEDAGVTLLVEPLNTLVDHKGYYLSSSEEAFEIHDEVNSPNVKILYDIYHQQIMEGHLISRITENISRIAHFHAAGNPGRHEIDRGEIHYREVFKAIQATGYDGCMGLEYFPLRDPVEGLREILSW